MVGTTIDHRLRLGFTTAEPATAVAAHGVMRCGAAAMALRDTDHAEGSRWARRYKFGTSLLEQLRTTVPAAGFDDRSRPFARSEHDEDRLVRLLVCAT